jgi:hypothetical protein
MSDFKTAIQSYLDYAKNDYVKWGGGKSVSGYALSIESGKKFAKVIHSDINGNHRSVHSFIVLNDGKIAGGLEVKKGDVLKAASWKAPAKNFVRANVFDATTFVGNVSWAGVA